MSVLLPQPLFPPLFPGEGPPDMAPAAAQTTPLCPRVVVVGAGLAGLSAALRLHAAGLAVTVLDPSPPGGKAGTIEPIPGWYVERGPHSFTHRAAALWEMAREVGVAHRAVRLGAAARARYLVRGGRLRRAPLAAVRFAEWGALVRGLFRRVADVPGESVADWCTRRFGPTLTTGVFDAILTGIWASDPAHIEMDTAFPMLAGLVRTEGSVFQALRALRRLDRRAARVLGQPAKGTWGFPDGMAELVGAAAGHLGPALRTASVARVTRVDTESMGSGGSSGSTGSAYRLDTSEGVIEADAVVLAVDAEAVARLVAEVAPDAVAPLGEVRYAPLTVAHWTSPDAAFPHGFGFIAAHVENRSVLGCIFVSDLFARRAPPGHRSFATLFGGGRRPENADLDEPAARRRIEREHLELTGRPVTIQALHLLRHPAAVAPPAPGHAERLARVRAALPPGLVVAGAWCGAGAVDDAICAGRAAADALAPVICEAPVA